MLNLNINFNFRENFALNFDIEYFDIENKIGYILKIFIIG